MSSRRVLVTGASRGIGEAIARAFAAHGDRVALHHRNSPGLAEQVLAELPVSESGGHAIVSGDLADPASVRAFVDAAAAALGGLDVVVNNAATAIEHPILEHGYDEWQAAWQETLAVNLVGPANVCWCAARHLGPGGRIINVSSRGAFRGEPRYPAYGAAKAGLNSLTQSLALALGPSGIAVTAVAPGFVATDMGQAIMDQGDGDAIRAQSPFNRVARPEEVADAVLFLASSEWSSGSVLDLNGASYFR
ncbi:SDR family NAD(P)-dependent oxidoreductase [Dactylosporangium sucinum]|uniref:NAD-dependent epimerase n=1 Tax=Dactylosporangium sucinum TaxID=1424081 RepID=A0A917X3E9_9ACTN|nr:SDR family oxidoreductase [Dactylosporangium sucinum]GGM60394.1 NAD-dependent epimerase [Dactylosporangium sucinum]